MCFVTDSSVWIINMEVMKTTDEESEKLFDTIIKSVEVFDGTGAKPFICLLYTSDAADD